MSTSELAWFKSSYSGTQGDDCLEVALDWRKSTYSSDQDDSCVEVVPCPSTIHIRDSKLPHSPQLALSAPAWSAFVGSVAHP